jgi:DNA-binding transcriptional MerR regulator
MDPVEPLNYDLYDLAERAGVPPRTIRYYIQEGLLPSPGQVGPGVKYSTGYLARLRLIRRLQRDRLPLAEIRKRLLTMDDDAVEAVLQEPEPAMSSAADYVRAVMGSPGRKPTTGGRSPRMAAVPSGAVLRSEPAPLGSVQEPRFSPSIHKPRERSQWERLALSDDFELHIRRPLSRDANRRLERLLEQARRIFQDEP